MNSDGRFPELEDCLRRDAERLHAWYRAVTPLTQLQTGYRRSRSRRTVRRVTALLALVLALAAFLPAFYGRVVGRPAEEPSIGRTITPLESPTQGRRAEPAAEARHIVAAEPPETSRVVAIPIVIIRDEDGRQSMAPGLLVPAHEAPVQIFDLSPVEQRAVRRVLSPEGQSDFYEAI